MPESLAWDAVLSLLRWQRTRHGTHNDIALLQTGLALLQPDTTAAFGPESALRRAERAFNVPYHCIASEVLHFAVFRVTKTTPSDGQPTRQAWQLLELALHAVKDAAPVTALPLNACNLLLSALAERLAKRPPEDASWQMVQSVQSVLMYLFGLSRGTTTATFHLYRPPMNVYADFLTQALSALFRALVDGTTRDSKTSDTTVWTVRVELVHAILRVYYALQTAQTNRKKVFVGVGKTLFKDIVSYRHALVVLATTHARTSVAAARALLDQLVADALFDPAHLCHYDSAMVHCAMWDPHNVTTEKGYKALSGPTPKTRRLASGAKATSGLQSYQKTFFDELVRLLVATDVPLAVKASLGDVFEVLVHEFATRIRAVATTKREQTQTDGKTSRKRAASIMARTATTYSPFKFWSELCAVVYVAYHQSATEPLRRAFVPIFRTLGTALFRALDASDAYRVTEDTLERTHFGTMEHVLAAFLDVLTVEQRESHTPCSARACDACALVVHAVQCSPNLVQTSLVAILELLGAQASSLLDTDDGQSFAIAVSHAVVVLLHAFVSMRLLDVFFAAVFAMQRGHKGWYQILTLARCNEALRQAFVGLPPGQMPVLWKLLVQQLASYAVVNHEDCTTARTGTAVARLLFQTFVQAIPVVPQNRSQVSDLVLVSHDQLFSTQLTALANDATPALTWYQHELVGLFGELLVFYSIVDVSVRNQTFDCLLSRLRGDRFGTVMARLLRTESHQASRGTPSQEFGTMGILQLGIFWLGHATSGTASKGRTKVTRLLVEYVVHAKCWDAVSFHLPELMAHARHEESEALWRALLESVMREDKAAKRMMNDAGFYEIASLQQSAPTAWTSMVQRFTDELQTGTLTSLARPVCFFDLILAVPVAYLKPAQCTTLLVAVLSLYTTMGTCPNVGRPADLSQRVVAWLQQHYRRIGMAMYHVCPALSEPVHDGGRLLCAQLVADEATSVAVQSEATSVAVRSEATSVAVQSEATSVAVRSEATSVAVLSEVLRYFFDTNAEALVAEVFTRVFNDPVEVQGAAAISRKLLRAALVVEAIVPVGGTKVAAATKQFVETVVAFVTHERVSELTTVGSYKVLAALVKYQSQWYRPRGPPGSRTHDIVPLIGTNLGRALAAAMRLLVSRRGATTTDDAAWSLFTTCCHAYATFRAFVTPLKTFGCLLAVSLACHATCEHALHALVATATREEFHLLVATLVHELAANEASRQLGALRALCLLLGTLHGLRRQWVRQYKAWIVPALVQNVGTQALDCRLVATTLVRQWTLKAFVLVVGTPELFAWQRGELQHVYTGFQPLVAAVAQWQAGRTVYTVHEAHELWTLSYTLLLRVVRTQYTSSLPHLVQATNALLQLLVLASARPDMSHECTDWSAKLARVYGSMKDHVYGPLRKHVVYLLMAYLVSATRDHLPVRYQQRVRPGIFALLDVCSTHETEQLYSALDSAGKALLQTLDTQYKLTHRYVGKN